MKDMSEITSVSSPFVCVSSGSVKALATLPMMRLMEGRMAPARMDEMVPMMSRTLSTVVRYLKNLKRETFSYCSC